MEIPSINTNSGNVETHCKNPALHPTSVRKTTECNPNNSQTTVKHHNIRKMPGEQTTNVSEGSAFVVQVQCYYFFLSTVLQQIRNMNLETIWIAKQETMKQETET